MPFAAMSVGWEAAFRITRPFPNVEGAFASATFDHAPVKNGTLKTYKDLPHGLCSTHPEIVNPDLLAFIREDAPVKNDETASRPVMA